LLAKYVNAGENKHFLPHTHTHALTLRFVVIEFLHSALTKSSLSHHYLHLIF